MSANLPGGTGFPEDTEVLEDAGILHDAGLGNGSGPVEPGLRALLGLLNSGPTPDELIGENSALEMFRANRRQADFTSQPVITSERGITASSAMRAQLRRSRWLAAAGTVMAAAAVTAAAYTQALPAPLQNAAYHVLGFAGVPQAHHVPRAPGNTRPARHARPHGISQAAPASPAPTMPAPRPSPQPTPVKGNIALVPANLSVTVVKHRVVAGLSDVLIARLTSQGDAVPGTRLYLLERPAGEHAWHIVAHGTTGPNGRVVVTVTGLTTNAAFRFRGPHGALSRQVQVIVVPPVSVTIVKGPRKSSETVIAGSSLAVRGDLMILQARIDGRWLTVQVRRYVDSQVRFVVKVVSQTRAYRVVLLGTKAHGRSVSKSIMVSG